MEFIILLKLMSIKFLIYIQDFKITLLLLKRDFLEKKIKRIEYIKQKIIIYFKFLLGFKFEVE